MNINDIIKIVSPEKANNFLNSFIQSVLLSTPKTYEFDENVLRSDENKTGMMVPPDWAYRPKPRIDNFEDLQNSLYGSKACAECRAAQNRPGAPMNITDPCSDVCR